MNSPSVGTPFICLDEVDSTNNYAMRQIAEGGIKEGTAWHANFQRQGRGQRGKRWQAAAGDNINLSVVLQPVMLPPSQSFVLNAVVALAACDFFTRYAGGESSIKWSNDVYWRDKKAGGILIENVIRGSRWTHAVIGMGVNLNQERFPASLPNPVSLRQITGRSWNPVALAGELCKHLEARYHALDPAKVTAVIEEYEHRMFRLREPALFVMKEETFEGCILGVEKDGRLILRRGKQLLRVAFGEVRFVV